MRRAENTIGLLGDVHASDRALGRALAWMRSRLVHPILCVGDIVDGCGDVDRCCMQLAAADIVTVAGNHDQWCVERRFRRLPHATQFDSLRPDTQAFIRALPLHVTISTPMGDLLLCHGLGADSMRRIGPDLSEADRRDLSALAKDGYRVVACGHTHSSGIIRHGHVVVVNPGTLASTRPGYAVLNLRELAVDFFDIAEDVIQHVGTQSCR